MKTPEFKQTKFLLAAFIITVATVMALFSMAMGAIGRPVYMDVAAWWGVAGTILAAYSASHITDTHLQQKKQVAPGDQVT